MDFNRIIPLFEKDPRILALYLLGSAHSGRMRPDSDIDMAVLIEGGLELPALERAELAASATMEFGRDVDLGEISSRNLVYARQVILAGRRLYARDSGRADLRETSLLGMYAGFFEERREVANAYRSG
jgi:predicted nucleotidyltransferase